MSNRLFQGVIYQMKDAFDRVIGVIDENGVVISCSDLGKMGDVRQGVREELSFSTEFMSVDGYTYRYMGVGTKSEYIVFVEGEDKMAEKMSKLLAISLGNIKSLYDEKYDKGSFIKNIINFKIENLSKETIKKLLKLQSKKHKKNIENEKDRKMEFSKDVELIRMKDRR